MISRGVNKKSFPKNKQTAYGQHKNDEKRNLGQFMCSRKLLSSFSTSITTIDPHVILKFSDKIHLVGAKKHESNFACTRKHQLHKEDTLKRHTRNQFVLVDRTMLCRNKDDITCT